MLPKLLPRVPLTAGSQIRLCGLPDGVALWRRQIKTLVLDEADEMLSKGFKEQIYDVYRYLPPETQVGRLLAAAFFGHAWLS